VFQPYSTITIITNRSEEAEIDFGFMKEIDEKVYQNNKVITKFILKNSK